MHRPELLIKPLVGEKGALSIPQPDYTSIRPKDIGRFGLRAGPGGVPTWQSTQVTWKTSWQVVGLCSLRGRGGLSTEQPALRPWQSSSPSLQEEFPEGGLGH